MVESPALIFLGSDETKKQERLELLSKKLFPPTLKDLNTNILYGDDKRLSVVDLKEALSGFPTPGAQKRLVVIRRAHRLNKALRDCLTRELRAASENVTVVLDVPESKGTEDFVGELTKAGAQTVRFKIDVPPSVFDLGRLIMDQRPDEALKVLTDLLQDREKSEKILGALFWQWDHFYSQKRLSDEQYAKGLKLIGEADRRLKSSVSAYARESLILEALVVKLSYLSR